MEFRKMVMITPYAKQKKRHRYIEQPLDSVGEGEGGMFQENSIETCILSRVKQPRLDAWDKCFGLVHWEDPEGSGREGGVRGDQDGEYMYIHGWFMSMYDKNHYNIVK